jgi:hypothetical protein
LVGVSVRHQQHQHRADAFAARADDVLGNLIDERDLGMQALADHRIDRVHVGGNGLDDGVLGGGRQDKPVQLDYWCRDYTTSPRSRGAAPFVDKIV